MPVPPDQPAPYQPAANQPALYQPAANQPAPVPSSTTAPQPFPATPWQADTDRLPQAELPRAELPDFGMPAPGGWPSPAEMPAPAGAGAPASVPAETAGAATRWRRVAAAGAAAVAIALAAGGVGGLVGFNLRDHTPVQQLNSADAAVNARPIDRSSLASIAAAVAPTVVVIRTPTGEGSGVIIDANGLIVTNNHVVSGAQGNTVSVTFNSLKRMNATIVGRDPRTDLAVVKVSGVSGLTFATFANSDMVRVGDTVLAIGSPLGLQGSVTAGIVSALHRTITVSDREGSPFAVPGDQGVTTTIGDAIQTDAPINPGNSGGALVNTEGQVIGINSAILTSGSEGNIGVGFAISSNKVKSVAAQLSNGGKVSHPYLGVRVTDAENGGAQVASVELGGPADKAGLKVGDIVTKVDDKPIAGSEDLVAAVQAGSVGGKLSLGVTRTGSNLTITATLAESP
jgi:putative serine protease PepD